MTSNAPLADHLTVLAPQPATSAATRPRRAALRLTRRGRVLLLLLLVAVAFAAFSLGRVSGHAQTAPDPAPAALPTVVVQPGDTVWSVVRAHHPRGDIRDAVARVVSVNHLGLEPLTPGRTLLLPR